MYRIVLTTALCLLAVTANGSTFELKDPAAELYEEQNAPPQEEPAQAQPTKQAVRGGMHCTVDIDTAECFCIGKKSARRLEFSQQECMEQLRQTLWGEGEVDD
jgi:hypothetical protein